MDKPEGKQKKERGSQASTQKSRKMRSDELVAG